MGKTIEECNTEYKQYIDTHIANVVKAFDIYGQELCLRLCIDYNRLSAMIRVHDQSKYSEEEFEGFRGNFYPTNEEKNNEEDSFFRRQRYNSSWVHHLSNNSHHPEFWVYKDSNGALKAHDMDKYSIAEMLLDWAAMGFKFNDTAYEYWQNNRDKKPLSEKTIEYVDSVIDIFKNK